MNQKTKELKKFNTKCKTNFIDTLNTELFINNFYQYLFNKTYEFEVVKNKDVAYFSENDFKEIFERYAWFERAYFLFIKRELNTYFKWYNANVENTNALSELEKLEIKNMNSDKRYEREYFADIDDMFRWFDIVLQKYDRNYILMNQIVFGLIWDGIQLEDISQFENDCLSITSTGYYISTPNGFHTYKINKKIFDLCKEYSMSDKTYYINSFFYAPVNTKYLISRCNRTNPNNMFKSNIDVSPIIIGNFIVEKRKNWNELIKETGIDFKQLNIKSIMESGVYYKILRYEEFNHPLVMGDDNALVFMQRFISGSRMKLRDMYYKYFEWRKYFYHY